MTFQGEYLADLNRITEMLKLILKVLEEIAKNVKWIEGHADKG